ncbi:hypothetical protein [Lunatimonas lonarensis]|uniref:hypothetical protein n=1 Tax=Lunatimonas lonarensis TaxID=1232681 RepID=UPI0012DF8C46|nr:hypothetical protein [Lunatimonas lonarensis]
MTTKAQKYNDLILTVDRRPAYNSVFNQLAVSHLSIEKCFKDSSSLVDRFVH